MHRLLLPFLLLLGVGACEAIPDNRCQAGREGCQCLPSPGGACNEGLMCSAGFCVAAVAAPDQVPTELGRAASCGWVAEAGAVSCVSEVVQQTVRCESSWGAPCGPPLTGCCDLEGNLHFCDGTDEVVVECEGG